MTVALGLCSGHRTRLTGLLWRSSFLCSRHEHLPHRLPLACRLRPPSVSESHTYRQEAEMRNAAIALALAAVVFVVPAVGAAQQQSKTGHKVARGDQSFMKDAAQDNIGEIELGRLASQRGASDAVKQFGQRMATDHGTALDELKQLAQGKGMTLPTDTDRAHKRLHDRLSKLSGAEFDREYMKAM